MIHAIVEGIGLGLALAFLFGPAFFTLIQTSIDRGFHSAARLAFGIFLSDLFLVAISYLGASRMFYVPEIKNIIGIVGGCVLIGFGIYTMKHRVDALRKSKSIDEQNIEIKVPSSMVYIVKGFFLNMTNPTTLFFWFFWVGTITASFTGDEFAHEKVALFFIATLTTVLSTDLLKAFAANQLKRYITDHVLIVINRVVGILLAVFGIYLIVMSIWPSTDILPVGL